MTNSKKLLQGLSRALWDSDLVATRISLAVGEFAWAVMLLWPGDTFGRPTYAAMSHAMTEEAWGFLLLLSAATQITIVMTDEYHHWFSRFFAAWNGMVWTFLIISMLLSVSPPPAAIGGEIAMALAACWVWLRPALLRGMYEQAERGIDEPARF